MDFRDWKMGVAIPAVALAGCNAPKPDASAVFDIRPRPPAPSPAPAPTVSSLAAEYDYSRAQADKWTEKWKTAEALRAAIAGNRPPEEVEKRRAEYLEARR